MNQALRHCLFHTVNLSRFQAAQLETERRSLQDEVQGNQSVCDLLRSEIHELEAKLKTAQINAENNDVSRKQVEAR